MQELRNLSVGINGIDVYVLEDTSATIVKQVSPKNKDNLILSI